MSRFFVLAALLAVTVSVSASPPSLSGTGIRMAFDKFMSEHGKLYDSVAEHEHRFNIFATNMKEAHRLTVAHGGKATFGATRFADLSKQEFQKFYLGFKPDPVNAHIRASMPVTRPSVHGFHATAPPTSDWRTKGAVSPVKDQGQCGSCWAFSATEAVETGHFFATQNMVPLAPEQIVDCDTAGSDQGCNGGDTVTAYAYLQGTAGQESEADYPYVAGGGTASSCSYDASKAVASVLGFSYATAPCNDTCSNQDELTLAKNVAAHGPASICVNAEPWQMYMGGIMDQSQCTGAYSDLDHCVHLVGLANDSTGTYWLVKNSWADIWGNAGYIYLSYGSNTCGVADEATFVKAS